MTTAGKKLSLLVALIVIGLKQNLFACATCYGVSDSPLGKGMNWGIMVLLAFIFSVLVAVTGVVIHFLLYQIFPQTAR